MQCEPYKMQLFGAIIRHTTSAFYRQPLDPRKALSKPEPEGR